MKTKSSRHFQTIIIGDGLTGLLVASNLSQKGESVALIDSLEQLGGEHRAHLSTFGMIDHGLKFLPSGEESQAALSFLKNWMPDLEWHEEEVPPVTFDGGHFKPFVGFGAKSLEAADEASHYLATSRLTPSIAPHAWIEQIQNKSSFEFFSKSFVTFIQAENDQISSIVVNSKETLTADRYIFCDQPKDLLNYAASNSIAPRLRQKIAKAEFYTSIGLELFHSQPVTESNAVHVLWSPSDDGAPCVGQFHPVRPQTPQSGSVQCQHSQWLTFVPYEMTEDNELTGAAIRKIKKQIKRAYPEAFEKLHGEIIFVAPGSHGFAQLKQKDDEFKLSPFENLYLATSQLEAQNPLVAAILQAEKILNCSDFNPTEHTKPTTLNSSENTTTSLMA